MFKKTLVFFAALTLLVGCSSTFSAQEVKSSVGVRRRNDRESGYFFIGIK